MKGVQAICVAAFFALLGAEAAPLGPKDKAQCCTTCHRFGMKVLGDWNPAFAGINNPVDCCNVCDTVFAATAPAARSASFLQTAAAPMSANKCKTICHRFGMKSLGGEFAALESPVECAALCEKKYA
mmetsp:Transcript_28554/g.64765  ORF Transcript_28554/g.64765 Transcript_28554/m.64765 type:complete len:127 (-) Transcript_28554:149-529(-)